MPGSISDFKSSFRKDLARSNKFDVFIPIPLGMTPFIGQTRKLAFRCESATLPGRNLEVATQRIYGINESFPYSTTFDPVTLTFMVGDDMKEKTLFDSWINWIQPTLTYDVKYKSDYAVLMRINQYDVENKVSLSIDLIDAYPVAVNQLDLDWSSDSIHKLAVTFAYTSWRSNDIDAIATEYLEYRVINGDFMTSVAAGRYNIAESIASGEREFTEFNQYREYPGAVV